MIAFFRSAVFDWMHSVVQNEMLCGHDSWASWKGKPAPRSWAPGSLVPAQKRRNREMSVTMEEEGGIPDLQLP